MTELNQASDEELREELARREKATQEAKKPHQVKLPDLTELRGACQSYIDELAGGKNADSDSTEYIFEAAMETLYGKDIFNWINERLK